MTAGAIDLSVTHDQDLIRILYRRQSVCDDQERLALYQLRNGSLTMASFSGSV